MKNTNWIIFKSNHHKPESETAYNKLSQKNKDKLNEWLNEKSILSKSEKRAGNRKRAIIKLLTFVNKDYDKITYEDYVAVASAISKANIGYNQKNGDREHITRFLKENIGEWENKFKGLKLLKLEKQTDDKKISHNELITELELDKLMKSTTDMKEISLIAVLFESASRPEELLKLKWNDVNFKDGLIYLYSAKTGKKRAVPVDSSIKHLKRLKEETDGREENLVFPSVSGKVMTIAGLNFMLHRLGEKAGIKRRIWAYLFRHTRLSCLITKLSPKVYEEVSGHSLEMGMKTYAHLSQDAVIKEMREKVFEIKELSPDRKNELLERIKILEKVLIEEMMSKPEVDKKKMSSAAVKFMADMISVKS